MNLTPLKEIPDSLVLFNRERYKGELAQGIYELMRLHGINRKRLADLMGVGKSRISHILSGDRNLGADSLADILLILGRTPHLTLGTDFDEIRLPVDEAASGENHHVRAATTATTASAVPIFIFARGWDAGTNGIGKNTAATWPSNRMGGVHDHDASSGSALGNVEVLLSRA